MKDISWSDYKWLVISFIFMFLMIILGTCCGIDSRSESESSSGAVSESEATANVGNTDVDADISVSAVTVESGASHDAETTFADVAMYLLTDKVFGFLLKVFIVFHMVVEVVILYGFLSGNIDPRKPFKLFNR